MSSAETDISWESESYEVLAASSAPASSESSFGASTQLEPDNPSASENSTHTPSRADAAPNGKSVQIIDGSGAFMKSDLSAFIQQSGLAGPCLRVSIVGPQSGGKSTLLNTLFGTRFKEMDALLGLKQTTTGIWLAQGNHQSREQPVLVLDVEGSDGREQGENTTLEKQLALFVLVESDILIVNIQAKEVGRETAAGKELLKTIFQVYLRAFDPEMHSAERKVLLFVLRDKGKTPLHLLKTTWLEDLESIWTALPKPAKYSGLGFQHFFEACFAELSNRDYSEGAFEAECKLLRQRFTESGQESLMRSGMGLQPARALPVGMQDTWNVVSSQEVLNTAAQKVKVARVMCTAAANNQLSKLRQDREWKALQAHEIVEHFGTRAASIMDLHLGEYDAETYYYDIRVRDAKRLEVVTAFHDLGYPLAETQLTLLMAAAKQTAEAELEACRRSPKGYSVAAPMVVESNINAFCEAAKAVLVPGCFWTGEGEKREFSAYIKGRAKAIISEQEAMACESAKVAAVRAVTVCSASILQDAQSYEGDCLWPRLQAALDESVIAATEVLEVVLAGYGFPAEKMKGLQNDVRSKAQAAIENSVREVDALPIMKKLLWTLFERGVGYGFFCPFMVDGASTGALACAAAAHVVYQLSVNRFDPLVDAGSLQPISQAFFRLSTEWAPYKDILCGTSWKSVPMAAVFVSPPQCLQLWKQFKHESSFKIAKVKSAKGFLYPLYGSLALATGAAAAPALATGATALFWASIFGAYLPQLAHAMASPPFKAS